MNFSDVVFQDIRHRNSRVRHTDLPPRGDSWRWIVHRLSVAATDSHRSRRCSRRIWLWPSSWTRTEEFVDICEDRQCLADLHSMGQRRRVHTHHDHRYGRVSDSAAPCMWPFCSHGLLITMIVTCLWLILSSYVCQSCTLELVSPLQVTHLPPV